METLIHADIFFFITSIFVIFLIVGLIIVIGYAIPILRDMREISRMAREGGEGLSEDLHDLRKVARAEGVKAKTIFDWFAALFVNQQRASKAKKLK